MKSPFDKLNEDHLNALLDVAPEVGTALGLLERDDQWPDPSEASREEALRRLSAWQSALMDVPQDALSDDQKLDREVFGAHLKLVEYAHTQLASRRHDPDVLSPVCWTLFRQLRAPGVPDEQRFLCMKERLRLLDGFLTTARAGVLAPDALWLQHARDAAAQMPAMVRSIQEQGATAAIPLALKEDLARSVEAALTALGEHDAWLRGMVPSDRAHWVLGEERFNELLKLRRISLDSAELGQMGERCVEEYRIERTRAAQRLYPGKPAAEALAAAQTDLPEAFDAVLDRMRGAILSARKFVQEQDLCALPETEGIEVLAAPASLSPLIPFSALFPASNYAPTQASVLLVTLPVDGLLGACNVREVENTAIHEGYPGHHVQQATANRSTSVPRNGVPLGYFADPSAGWAAETVEGWAHYCAEMMREQGFEAGPASRLQTAQGALWRAHRMVIDVGLATGRMTLDEATARLRADTEMTLEAASAEVRRCTRLPGYALSSLYGKQEVFHLRKRASELWRDQFSLGRFHGTLLSMGCVPLHFVRARLEPAP
jgi:uncharacterized protein (DUF885 family)